MTECGGDPAGPGAKTILLGNDEASVAGGKHPTAAAGSGKAGDEERQTWGGKLDFVMSALSFAVGMGNLWRFPYLCYRNGGGAFLIPYVIIVVMVGFPIMYLEFCLGQYGRKGIVKIWNAVPLFSGIGWGMWVLSIVVALYYNVLIAWCFFYIFASFAKDVPWRTCGNAWNTENCADTATKILRRNCTVAHNGTFWNSTCWHRDDPRYDEVANLSAAIRPVSPSDEYFHNFMLDISPDVEDVGSPRWQIVLCLLFVWTIICLCLSKGIQSSGKATYVTAVFPYIIMSVLFVRGLLLDGAADGISYFITPDFEKLLSPRVWGDAAVQVFFSMSICWGGLITLASYNDFHSNAFRDALVVAAGDTLTSIFGGVIIFSYIGYMAKQLGVGVPEVATQGPGLAFIVYPEAVTLLPVSQLWNILFMLVLINVGLGTAFALIQTVQLTLVDMVPALSRGRRPLAVLVSVCAALFLLGIPITTRGGIYILSLLDNYAATYSVLFFGFMITVAIGWFYGGAGFNPRACPEWSKNIEHMLGKKPSVFWIISWKYVCPIATAVIFAFLVADFKRTSYGEYTLPGEYDVGGWFVFVAQVLCVFGVPVCIVLTGDKKLALRERIKALVQPTAEWGPPPEICTHELGTPLKEMNANYEA